MARTITGRASNGDTFAIDEDWLIEHVVDWMRSPSGPGHIPGFTAYVLRHALAHGLGVDDDYPTMLAAFRDFLFAGMSS